MADKREDLKNNDSAAITLNALESQIDTSRMNPPSFKMVLTAVVFFLQMGLLIWFLNCRLAASKCIFIPTHQSSVYL